MGEKQAESLSTRRRRRRENVVICHHISLIYLIFNLSLFAVLLMLAETGLLILLHWKRKCS
jgi:hypothetical protein